MEESRENDDAAADETAGDFGFAGWVVSGMRFGCFSMGDTRGKEEWDGKEREKQSGE